MGSGRDRTTAKAPRVRQGESVRRCLLVFDTGRTRTIDLPPEGVLVVGRGDDVDVVLSDPSVSRRQLELAIGGEEVVVRDLDSSNGTLLGEEPLVGARPLRPGVVLRAGATILLVAETGHGRDPGCLSHLEIDARLAGRIDEARAGSEPVAVFLVRSTAAPEIVAGALRKALGGDVAVGEYGAGHYEVVTGAGPGGKSTDLAQSLARSLRSSGVTADVGCARYPRDGSSQGELLAACSAALRAAPAPSPGSQDGPVVVDPALRRVFDMARRVAAGRIPVLILGETGTGKEVLAEHVHRCSPRAHRPFVRLNCAALPEPLLEAELFGYERGAFTGAHRPKPGLFEVADGGTVMLDEVGDLPPGQQAKLLRALEDGTVRRLGSLKDLKVDVRLIAATNKNLDASEGGAFRPDLYFRLSGAILTVPPLRERPTDIGPLARRFLAQIGTDPVALSALAEEALSRYTWPGNVRELRNALERASLLAGDGVIAPEHLPDRLMLSTARPGAGAPTSSGRGAERRSASVRDEMRELERARIVEALAAEGGNQTHAARRLGMARRTLVTKLAALGLTRRRPRPSPPRA